jgi:hypothetical protein
MRRGFLEADPDEERRVVGHGARGGDGFKWIGESDKKADDLLVDHDEEAKARRNATAHAKDICRSFLADGEWHASAVLIARALEDGISERCLRSARVKLGVECEQRGDGWWSRLPKVAAAA